MKKKPTRRFVVCVRTHSYNADVLTPRCVYELQGKDALQKSYLVTDNTGNGHYWYPMTDFLPIALSEATQKALFPKRL